MIAILNYVLLGIILYIVVIPIIEELTTIIVQALEVVKGFLVLKIAELQIKADSEKPSKKTRAIGFTYPQDDSEEDNDDD